MKQRRLKPAMWLGLTSLLVACATGQIPQQPVLDEMQVVALCQQSPQAISIESKIAAEYGFKRFAENTYRPVVEQRLFGHDVRVIELSNMDNKLYVAGNPLEFGHHFQRLLPDIACEKNTCQAPLGSGQSLFIYKVNHKKSKDTTVIECTKMPSNVSIH